MSSSEFPDEVEVAEDSELAASAAVCEPTARRRAAEAGEVAWIAALPCALVVVAAIVALGPLLGRAFFGPGSVTFLPGTSAYPEPTEHARYALAVVGPLLLVAVVLASTRRPVRLHPTAIRVLVSATRLVMFVFLAVCLAAQRDVIFKAYVPPSRYFAVFSLRTLETSAVLSLLFLTALYSRRVVDVIGRLTQESRGPRTAYAVLAVALLGVWLLTAINFDSTVGVALGNNLIPWDMSETFAVLNGRTPFVDFHAQYSQLWPYVAAAAMTLVGNSSIGAWTMVMTTISGLALIAVYSIFRRITSSSLLALAIFVPFLATSYWQIEGSANRFSVGGIFSLWPLRYAGPYLLAWLTARHVDRVAPRRAALLFFFAGLVALNNAEFGIGAFLATFVALACHTPPTWRAGWRLLASAGAGLLSAALLIGLLSLIRTGDLPDFTLLLEFSRIYGMGGWVLEPMATIGFHIAIYTTLVVAIVVAIVRAARSDENPVLTSMLGWSGVFGLFAGSYYAGRSDPLSLVSLLSAWSFALSLLFVVVTRSLVARGGRRPTLPELAVVFAFFLSACSLAQLPAPWLQLQRLRQPAPTEVFKQAEATAFIDKATRPGEKVAILIPLGHRIAYDLGLVNVAPYASAESMPTKEQMATTLGALRREHVHKVFIAAETTLAGHLDALVKAGFSAPKAGGFGMLTDLSSRS